MACAQERHDASYISKRAFTLVISRRNIRARHLQRCAGLNLMMRRILFTHFSPRQVMLGAAKLMPSISPAAFWRGLSASFDTMPRRRVPMTPSLAPAFIFRSTPRFLDYIFTSGHCTRMPGDMTRQGCRRGDIFGTPLFHAAELYEKLLRDDGRFASLVKMMYIYIVIGRSRAAKFQEAARQLMSFARSMIGRTIDMMFMRARPVSHGPLPAYAPCSCFALTSYRCVCSSMIDDISLQAPTRER